MSRPRRPADLLLAVAVSGSLLSACGTSGTAPAAAGPTAAPTLKLVMGGDPTTLDPLLARDAHSFDVLNQTMEGLTREDSTGDVQPGIASSWQSTDGGLTWTFHLRHAMWSNGDPVRAADFVYAWRAALDPRNASPYSGQLRYLQGAAALRSLPPPPDSAKDPTAYQAYLQAQGPHIDQLLNAVGVTAPDDHTLVVHLAQTAPYWLGLTALPVYFPADQRQVTSWPAGKYGTDAQYTLSDGPFTVSAWTHGDHIRLTANPTYWDAAHVHLGGVDFTIVSDSNTVANLYDTGGIDALIPNVPHGMEDKYQAEPGFSTSPQLAVYGVLFNATDAGLSSADVRRALSEAIDRTALVNGVVKSHAVAAGALTPPGVLYDQGKHLSDLLHQTLGLSSAPAQAKADLAHGLAAAHLSALPPLTLLIVNAGGAPDEAAALQSMWAQNLGIQVHIQAVDGPTYVSMLTKGQFQLVLWGWNADYDDPETFLDLFVSGNADNFGHWSDPAYDAAMQAAESEPDLAKRGQDLATAEEAVLQQVAVAPLWFPVRNWIARPAVQGLEILPTGPDFDLKGVSIRG